MLRTFSCMRERSYRHHETILKAGVAVRVACQHVGCLEKCKNSVILSDSVIDYLTEATTSDADFIINNCLISGILMQVEVANVAGEMPHIPESVFDIMVESVFLTGHANRDVSGFLLSAASLDAVGQCLTDYEASFTHDQIVLPECGTPTSA